MKKIVKKIKSIDGHTLKYTYAISDLGMVYNIDKEKDVKLSFDKRRPNQGPAVYFQLYPKGRVCYKLDEVMARAFFKNYVNGSKVIHLDNDNNNCKLCNLEISDGIKILINKYGENKEWKSVRLENIKLYYDYYICEDGRLYNATTDNFIESEKDNRKDKYRNGYRRYSLYTNKMNKNLVQKEYRIKIGVARLVALHFIPKPIGKDKVIFKDSNSENCSKENLYWGDQYDVLFKNKSVSRTLTNETIENRIERWKPLKYFDYKFEDGYLISDFGRVYNKDKKFYVSLLKSSYKNPNNQYYISVLLRTKNKKFVKIALHRLVAYNFVKNKFPKLYNTVNHINGNPECNIYTNLEWCTHEWNMHHALVTHLYSTGSDGKFSGIKNTKYWRTIRIVSWIYSMNYDDISDAYAYYNIYKQKYSTDCSKLSFIEFRDIYYNRSNNDDINYIRNFYIENY